MEAIDVSLAYHTASVIKGRAYLFGGRTSANDGGQELATNDVHIVILPSSGVESTDYTKVGNAKDAPPARYGHCAAAIENRIYVFGGRGADDRPLEEQGRVWVFDTTRNAWSHFDPPRGAASPGARAFASAIASEHPRPIQKKQDANILPQQPPDPEETLPDIPNTDTYGTLIVHGGEGAGEKIYRDMWTFDISSRTWRQLPNPPPPATAKPSLAMVDSRLYTFSAGRVAYLDLDNGSFDDRGGAGELGLTPLAPWQSLPPTCSSPDKPHPGDRTAAPLIPVTTGQGRNYLLLVGGEVPSGEASEQIWALQLKPDGMTAASFKDAAREAIKKDTGEASWDEVKYHNADGVLVQENQPGRGIGTRKGLAAARGTEVDGASILIWGGIGADGEVKSDGLMVTVEA